MDASKLPPDVRELFDGPAMCAHKGCEKRATLTLVILLWAKGYSKEDTQPLTSRFSLKVCADHTDEVHPSTFFLPETKDRIAGALRLTGKAEPDFDTCEFRWVPLEGKLN